MFLYPKSKKCMSRVVFTRHSLKDLDRIGNVDRKRVLAKLEQLTVPLPNFLDIKILSGTKGYYRLRVGQVRVIFEIDQKMNQIWIRGVGYRGGIYRIFN